MQQQEAPADAPETGMVLARLDGSGPMAAIRTLRSEMQRRQPVRVTFLVALDGNGLTVSIADPQAEVLVLGYRRDRHPLSR